jgi:hypothetical protein
MIDSPDTCIRLATRADAAAIGSYASKPSRRLPTFRIANPAGAKGDAESKIAAMEAAGIRMSPARLGKTLVEVLKG